MLPDCTYSLIECGFPTALLHAQHDGEGCDLQRSLGVKVRLMPHVFVESTASDQKINHRVLSWVSTEEGLGNEFGQWTSHYCGAANLGSLTCIAPRALHKCAS